METMRLTERSAMAQKKRAILKIGAIMLSGKPVTQARKKEFARIAESLLTDKTSNDGIRDDTGANHKQGEQLPSRTR